MLFLVASLFAAVVAAADAPATPTESKLAPNVAYLEMWTFLHGKDPAMPKVLYLPKVPEDGEAAPEAPPSWLTSAAMAFKDGRKYTAKFAVVPSTDTLKVAKRFGIAEELLPALLGCHKGMAHQLPRSELQTGGGSTVRAVKSFVNNLVDAKGSDSDNEEGGGGDGAGTPMPSFPEPTRPRKQASASLEEFTHESLPLNCYGGSRPLCVFAVLNQPIGQGCPDTLGELARKFRNDKTVAFGCVGAARQQAFLSGFGLAASELPALLAVKGGNGKRPRMARMEGHVGDDLTPMSAFVDSLLGGGVSFSRLADGLPELEPPYLLDNEDKDEP